MWSFPHVSLQGLGSKVDGSSRELQEKGKYTRRSPKRARGNIEIKRAMLTLYVTLKEEEEGEVREGFQETNQNIDEAKQIPKWVCDSDEKAQNFLWVFLFWFVGIIKEEVLE